MSQVRIAWNKGLKMPGMSGKNHPNWKGGKYKHSLGYIYQYSPLHPFKGKYEHILEHRLVMEKHLGRYLKPTEYCHHKNGNPGDNRIRNLFLCKDRMTHRRLHFNYKLINGKWKKKCPICKKWPWVNKENFYIHGNLVHSRCKKCNYKKKVVSV